MSGGFHSAEQLRSKLGWLLLFCIQAFILSVGYGLISWCKKVIFFVRAVSQVGSVLLEKVTVAKKQFWLK